MNIFEDLRRREARLARPLNAAVLGAGFLGSGLIRQLRKVKGMAPALVANRTPERAVEALRSAGIDPLRIRECGDPDAAARALDEGFHVVTREHALAAHVPQIDVVLEATGTMHIGAAAALAAIENKKHVVEANPEVMATVGFLLKRKADEAGVVYSDIDGDQPGILMNLYHYCAGLGLEPVIAGNCKGVMKRYATPATQEGFARAAGIATWIATAAADGTKLNLEMAIVANATGMAPARTGMTGVETGLDSLLAAFRARGLLDGPPAVEYTIGIPSGVFFIARSHDPHLAREFRYLKMGDGPEYLFYRPYVLCHFEAPLTAAEAVLYGTATLTPRGEPTAEVAAFAKRDLSAGEPLGGMGGENHYGLILREEEARREDALPVGLAEYGILRRAVKKDQLLRAGDVSLPDEPLAVRLRRAQEAMLAEKRREK